MPLKLSINPKKYLFEIVITLYKVEKHKPLISFLNQSNIKEK
jgi:hypothetical protein